MRFGRGENIKVATDGQVKKDRRYYRFEGNTGPDWQIPNSDRTTAMHTVLERVFLVKTSEGFDRPPQPTCDCKRRVAKFLKEIRRCAQKRGKSPAITGEEFVDSYSGAKRRIYEQALRRLGNEHVKTVDARIKLFVKDEYLKPGGTPRAIQPRTPQYNIALGRYLKHLEEPIFEGINEVFHNLGHRHSTIAKGMNQQQRGATLEQMWSCFDSPVAIGLDASRWDQHVSVDLLKLEHEIYSYWSEGRASDNLSLNELLRWQLRNRGKYQGTDGQFTYKVNGCRMSGDINTSLGNVVLMCMLMYTYFTEKQINFRLLNDGDDCAIVVDRKDVKKVKESVGEWFLQFGVEMTLDSMGVSLEDIEFCQCHPVRVGGTYVMVPRPTKRLYSDTITTKDVSSKTVYERQLGAVAGCGLAQSSGTPIFQEFYSWLGKNHQVWVPEENSFYYKYRDELVRGMEFRYLDITDDTRISFFKAFNITPSEQLLLEEHYSTRQPLAHGEPLAVSVRHRGFSQMICDVEQKSLTPYW